MDRLINAKSIIFFIVLAIGIYIVRQDIYNEGILASASDKHEALVYLKNPNLHEGAKVNLLKQFCVPKTYCYKYKIGEGEITKIFTNQYFVINIAENVKVDKEVIVETK